MVIGPIQMIVLGFRHAEFHGEIVTRLDDFTMSEPVRVIDALALTKDAGGDIAAGRIGGATHDVPIALEGGQPTRAVVEVFSYEQMSDTLETLPGGSAAVLVLVEHHWAFGLRDAIAAAGGFRISDGFITPLDARTQIPQSGGGERLGARL